MKRCKHLNGDLVESILIEHAKPVVDGVVDEIGYHSTGDTVGHRYECRDCKAIFPINARTTQKWLLAIYNQLSDM